MHVTASTRWLPAYSEAVHDFLRAQSGDGEEEDGGGGEESDEASAAAGDVVISEMGRLSMVSAMELLKGSVYESLENYPLAARCYSSALRADPLNQVSFTLHFFHVSRHFPHASLAMFPPI